MLMVIVIVHNTMSFSPGCGWRVIQWPVVEMDSGVCPSYGGDCVKLPVCILVLIMVGFVWAAEYRGDRLSADFPHESR